MFTVACVGLVDCDWLLNRLIRKGTPNKSPMPINHFAPLLIPARLLWCLIDLVDRRMFDYGFINII